MEQSATTTLSRLLGAAFQLQASDIHIKADSPPMYRVQGQLRPVELPPIGAEELRQLSAQLSGFPAEDLARRKQVEFSCEWSADGRFRGHYYEARGKPALALRAIPRTIPSMQDLRLPPVIRRLCSESRGLILICGATGNGKSSTLASMVDCIAKTSCRHIVTIEDPVEFLIEDGASCVTQREIGRDVSSFELGMVAALRQDPDIIMIGEVRDAKTMDVAMRAATSGHLVLAAAHFTDVLGAISGIVAMAPAAEQSSCRHRLADSLTAIISQRLMIRRDGVARVLATEVLINDPTIRSCIIDETKMKGIRPLMARGRNELGSHTFDQALLDLLQSKMITLEVAKSAASSPSELMREVNLRRIPTS